MDRKLVIWGASGHALVVADIIRLRAEYEIVGFLDDFSHERYNTQFCGASILGGREQLDALRCTGIQYLIFGIGDCNARLRLSQLAISKGFTLATAIHPQATIAMNVLTGPGTVIAAGVVVNAGTTIDENVIINTCASVDHECLVQRGAHIGPGAHLGGRVIVEPGVWIGIGATVRDRVRIGARSIIGAGAVVLKDVPEEVVAYGIPAKVIRRITPHDY